MLPAQSDSRGAGVLLTLEQVHSWRRERDALSTKIASLQDELDLMNERLEAARIFLPDHSRAALDAGSAGPVRVTRFILDLLRDAERGLTAEEIVDAGELQTFSDPGANESAELAVQAGLSRLHNKGRIKKRGELFYSAEYAEKHGLPELTTAGVGLQVGVARALEGKADGLTAAEIILALKADPETADRVERNKQYPYAVLYRMAQAGELERNGKAYRLPDASESKTAPSEDEGAV